MSRGVLVGVLVAVVAVAGGLVVWWALGSADGGAEVPAEAGRDADMAIENGTFATEPTVATDAVTAVAAGLMGDTPQEVLLRPDEDDLDVPDGWVVEFDPTTWERVGNIARVEATAAGEPFIVWLVRDGDRWLVSHTTEPVEVVP